MTQPVKRIGEYEIEDTLGQGAMGIVYRARHCETGEQVAIKTVFVSDKRKMLSIHREIRALARIRHPGVVRILREGIEDGNPWFAMDLVEGMLLDAYCAREIWQISDYAPDWTSDVQAPADTEPDFAPPREKIAELFGDTHDQEDWQDLPDGDSAPRPGVPKPVAGKKPPAAGGKLPEILDLALRICAPLEFLHGEGIVHRDLKPSNIMIRTDGTPVIFDFGLMLEFWGELGRDALESVTTSGGTLNYIPPEQIMGDTVDARADLYSFGCILYELITGQAPFIASSFLMATQAHLQVAPVPPSHLVEGVPEALDSLILNLLSKKPGKRIGHAGGVARILMDLGASDPHMGSYPPPKSYLYRPGFIGRKDIMAEMMEYLSQVKDGSGGMLLIGGESGIGKTRLLTEFGRKAFRERIRLLFGECLPDEGSRDEVSRISTVPFGALRKIFSELVEYCRKAGRDETDRLLGEKSRILLPYFPDLADLPGIDTYPDPADLPPDSARFRLFQALAQTLMVSTTTRTTLIFLDDLHWADHLTSHFLLFLLQSGMLSRVPVLVLGSYRPDEMPSYLERLVRNPRIKSVRLNRLDESDMKTLIGDMLALPDPTDNFASFLNSLSEGNPFFVAEYLRTCIEEKLLFRDAQGSWQITPEGDQQVSIDELKTLPLPGSLKNLVERRLASISGPARTLLEAAAVTGREFDPMVLWHNVSFSPDTLDAMDELIHRHVLDETAPNTLRFSQDVLQQIAYHQIEPDVKKELHRRTAESYETAYADRIDEYYPVIASHFDRAECSDRARYYYRLAGVKSLKNYSQEDAERAFLSYLHRVDTHTEESLGVRMDLAGKIFLFQGRLEDGFHEFSQILNDARNIGFQKLEAESLMGISQYHVLKGDHISAITNANKARVIFEKIDDFKGLADIYNQLITIYLREMELDKAKVMIENALKIYRRTGDRVGEAETLSQAFTMHIKKGQAKAAFECTESAMKINLTIGRHEGKGECLKDLGMYYWLKDEDETAKRLVNESLDVFREIGNRKKEGFALVLLALIHTHTNSLDEGARLFKTALCIQREMGDRYLEGLTLKNYGKLLFRQGKIKMVQETLAMAQDILNELGSPGDKVDIYLNLARMERQVFGNFKQANRYLIRARAIAIMIHDKLWLIWCNAEFGHNALAQNRSGQDRIDEIARSAVENDLENNTN